MDTTIAKLLPLEELEDLDRLRRGQGVSREDAVRDAVRWYVRWAERLPFEDPIADEA